jgi:hypothetical protein
MKKNWAELNMAQTERVGKGERAGHRRASGRILGRKRGKDKSLFLFKTNFKFILKSV